MSQHNAANERIKREYFIYLKEAKRYSTPSIDAAAAAISSFESCTHHRDFKAFRIEQAIAFKRKLSEQQNLRTGRKLSKATLYSTLQALRNFFLWLAGRPGFKSRLSYSDADYFNLSEKETRIAKAHREVATPTLEQIHHVIVRRQNIWLNSWRKLAEHLPRLGVDVKRRACGAASADVGWSFV